MRLTILAVLAAAALALTLAPSVSRADSGRSRLRRLQRDQQRRLDAEGDWQKTSLRREMDRREDGLGDWRDREKGRIRAAYQAAKFRGGMSAAEFLDRMRQVDRTYRYERDRLDDDGDWRRDELDDHFDRLEDELDAAQDYERDLRRHGHAPRRVAVPSRSHHSSGGDHVYRGGYRGVGVHR